MSIILGRSVQGFSHICNQKPCQDWHEILQIRSPEASYDIIAVADGHGSLSCPYSGDGSKRAARAFCELLNQYCRAYDMESLRFFLDEKKLDLAKKVVEIWGESIQKFHTDNGREPPTGVDDEYSILKQYGTTLLGVLVAPTFVYTLQVGDGDIVYVDSNGVNPLHESDNFLGVETWSMSLRDAWKKSHSSVRSFGTPKKESHMYMLTTDGFANSYATDDDFYSACQAYFKEFQDGKNREIDRNLTDWLNEISKEGCGDDVTAVFAFYEGSGETEDESNISETSVELSKGGAESEKHSPQAETDSSEG